MAATTKYCKQYFNNGNLSSPNLGGGSTQTTTVLSFFFFFLQLIQYVIHVYFCVTLGISQKKVAFGVEEFRLDFKFCYFSAVFKLVHGWEEGGNGETD